MIQRFIMGLFTASDTTFNLLAITACLLLAGCPLSDQHASVQGGETTVILSAEDWTGLPGSQYAETEGGTSTIQWGNSGAPDDGPGTTLWWSRSNSTGYAFLSSFGAAETDLEGGDFRLELNGFSGPGTYSGYDLEELEFSWRAAADLDTGDQATLAILGVEEGECVIDIDDPAFGGSIECAGLVPMVDGEVWAGAPFELSGTWLADDTPQD